MESIEELKHLELTGLKLRALQEFSIDIDKKASKLIHQDGVLPAYVLGTLARLMYNVNRTAEEKRKRNGG